MGNNMAHYIYLSTKDQPLQRLTTNLNLWNWTMLVTPLILTTIKRDTNHLDLANTVEKQVIGKRTALPTLTTKDTTNITLITTRDITITTTKTITTIKGITTCTRAKVKSTILRTTLHKTLTITWNSPTLRETMKNYFT